MNVMVYPEIRCKHDETRWWLVRPSKFADPALELTHEPREAQESIVTRLGHHLDTYHIPASLWKRSDDYFEGDRYDPNGITKYKIAENQAWSVDEKCRKWDPERRECVGGYCNPEEAPDLNLPFDPSYPCNIPRHGTEQVITIELKPKTAEISEAQEVQGRQSVSPFLKGD